MIFFIYHSIIYAYGVYLRFGEAGIICACPDHNCASIDYKIRIPDGYYYQTGLYMDSYLFLMGIILFMIWVLVFLKALLRIEKTEV